MIYQKINLSKVFIHTILITFSLLCILPLLLVLSISFTNEMEIIKNGYSLWPKEFTLSAYSLIFKHPSQMISSYMVTITVTVVGTVISMLITSMLAYTISRKDYPFANKTSFFVFFTMFFSGGLVSWYILVSRTFHMNDTIYALIIPYLVIPWNVLLMKGFLSATPMSIIESAKMDGAGELRIFFQLIIPLNMPGLTTLGLFCALMYWNDYYLSLMFIESNRFVSLQLLLSRIMSNIDFLNSAMAIKSGIRTNVDIPTQSARMAICILAAGPMMLVFPFLQKYFVKGLTVGAIKG